MTAQKLPMMTKRILTRYHSTCWSQEATSRRASNNKMSLATNIIIATSTRNNSKSFEMATSASSAGRWRCSSSRVNNSKTCFTISWSRKLHSFRRRRATATVLVEVVSMMQLMTFQPLLLQVSYRAGMASKLAETVLGHRQRGRCNNRGEMSKNRQPTVSLIRNSIMHPNLLRLNQASVTCATNISPIVKWLMTTRLR